MKKSNLIGGIICLVIAVLLTILNLKLSEDSMMFMVGGQNMPWTPPVVLGIIGIILLATGAGKDEESTVEKAIVVDEEKAALNKKLETIAWGCFLVMLGGFFFVPAELIEKGVWSIGVGVIMLGLNVVRYFYKIRMSGGTTLLGVLAIIKGVLELTGVTGSSGGVLLIILGAYLILKPWFDKRQLFGKAEEKIPPVE